MARKRDDCGPASGGSVEPMLRRDKSVPNLGAPRGEADLEPNDLDGTEESELARQMTEEGQRLAERQGKRRAPGKGR